MGGEGPGVVGCKAGEGRADGHTRVGLIPGTKTITKLLPSSTVECGVYGGASALFGF